MINKESAKDEQASTLNQACVVGWEQPYEYSGGLKETVNQMSIRTNQ